MREELSKGHVGQETLLVSPRAKVVSLSLRLPPRTPAPASAVATFSKQICHGRELITQHILPDIDVTDSK